MQRLLPPHLFVLSLVALGALWALLPDGLTMRQSRAMPWDIPLILGVGVLAWARAVFLRKEAEIMTFGTPRDLITEGPFRFSRNPMYLGFVLLLLAAALFVNAWPALAVPLAFLVISTLWYIPFEERKCREIFGAAYDTYANRTRRWI